MDQLPTVHQFVSVAGTLGNFSAHLISKILDGFLYNFDNLLSKRSMKYQEKTKAIFLNCAKISH